MDPLGTAAQAGGTVCWKGQEQACQYQETAHRIFYKLALIKWGGGATQEPCRCISAPQHFCTPKGQAPPPGSKAHRSSATRRKHQREVGGEWAASRSGGLQLALRPSHPAPLPGTGCNAAYKITYDQAPQSTASSASKKPQNFSTVFQPQSSCCTPHPWRESPWSPSQGCLHPGHGTDILPQPAPALPTLLCTYTCQVVQPDIYKALSKARGRTQISSSFCWIFLLQKIHFNG